MSNVDNTAVTSRHSVYPVPGRGSKGDITTMLDILTSVIRNGTTVTTVVKRPKKRPKISKI